VRQWRTAPSNPHVCVCFSYITSQFMHNPINFFACAYLGFIRGKHKRIRCERLVAFSFYQDSLPYLIIGQGFVGYVDEYDA
jgi:hypothetical protein